MEKITTYYQIARSKGEDFILYSKKYNSEEDAKNSLEKIKETILKELAGEMAYTTREKVIEEGATKLKIVKVSPEDIFEVDCLEESK